MPAKHFIVQVPRGVSPCCIDDFPSEVSDGKGKPRKFARSVEGSMRITPGDLAVTGDELRHLRKHHKDVARRLQVVCERPERPKPKAELPVAKEAQPRAEAGGEVEEPEAPKVKKAKSKSK